MKSAKKEVRLGGISQEISDENREEDSKIKAKNEAMIRSTEKRSLQEHDEGRKEIGVYPPVNNHRHHNNKQHHYDTHPHGHSSLLHHLLLLVLVR